MSEVNQITNDLYAIKHEIIVALAPEPIVAPKSPKAEKPTDTSGDVAFWGENNDFPQQVIELAKADPELMPLLDWKGRVLQGREVIAVNLEWNETKKDFDVVRINEPDINEFLTEPFFIRYWREACVDFTWFHNFFPDLIKSTDGAKIAYLGTHETAWSRWKKQNKSGVIETCYVASNWPEAKIEDETTLKIPVVDPYSPGFVNAIKSDKKTKRFVYPANYPMPGSSYYPTAPWIAYLFSEWAKIKKMIPKMKVTLMERLMSARWTLTIPVNYWPSAYKDWDKKTDAERLKIKKDKVAEINKNITGVDNTGRTLLFETAFDMQGNELPAWTLTPIEDAWKEGQYLEDSREATEYLNRGMSIDGALVGDGPGKTNNGNSSSDKRIAFNIMVALLNPYRSVILEPLYFVAKYNGWKDKYPNLRFKVLEIELETLDKAHATSKETNPVTTTPPAKGEEK